MRAGIVNLVQNNGLLNPEGFGVKGGFRKRVEKAATERKNETGAQGANRRSPGARPLIHRQSRDGRKNLDEENKLNYTEK